jgi:hypothetical protein
MVKTSKLEQGTHSEEEAHYIDLLIKISCFVKKEKIYSFIINNSGSELNSTRRSTVLTVPSFSVRIP